MDYQTVLASFDYDWDSISDKLYREYSIMSSTSEDGRIIFKSKNAYALSTPIASAFDGCIFSMHDMKLISKMDVYCRSSEIPKFSAETTFEEFYDGTSIGLYYFGDRWVMRSINGYDIENLSFYGNATFGELVGDGLNELPLDPLFCYSFCVKNTDFHQFFEGQSEPIHRIIHTATFELATGKRVDQDIGVPKPRKYMFTSTEDLRAQLFNSIKVFRKLKVPPTAIPLFVGESYTRNIFFGIIARSNETNYMFHSELYSLISRLLYTNKYNTQLKESGVDRRKFMALIASINDDDRMKYLYLCPQTAPYFAQIDSEIKKMIDIVFERTQTKTLNIRDKYFGICSMFGRFHIYPKNKYVIHQYIVNYDNLTILAKLVFE